jgi:molecular chaperone GrpE
MSEENRTSDLEPGADDIMCLDECRQALKACLQESEQRLQSMLRARADLENLRKRTDREIADTRKFANSKLLEALLPVMDSLEMGLSSSGSEADAEDLRRGIELTLDKLAAVFADFGVEIIDPQGQPFDPERHEAVMTLKNSELPVNVVAQVHQKGYLLNGRLIRPARVVVTTAS